jgi:leucyl aminopeptidase
MEKMKYDMAGGASMIAAMRAIAQLKPRVRVLAVVCSTENMPSGKAYKPGDVVIAKPAPGKPGKAIEIINTDAEGRLVLADVLWHVAKKFKPKFMVDLATLTGAIMVALGTENAGLFSNNDELAERLTKVGQDTGEKVWRMPLSAEYDKLIDSQFADMKNTGGRYGGSVTAAQFLQRFVDDIPWAHLDIAGTAMGAPKTEINHSWGSGFGVRLLERLVSEYYEK